MMAAQQTSPSRQFGMPRWMWFIVTPIIVLSILLIILALLPVEADAEIPESEWGVGTTTIEPSWTGLLREWPIRDELDEIDPDMANLGYQLFFDPVLSGDNTYSCAHCHHPERGFADGLTVAVGESGDVLDRHAPTLWNVAYNFAYFWDGRAESLEEQLVTPITEPHEMNQPFDELINELSAIEIYQEKFSALFEDGITQDNIAIAIATFERTLISDNAAFDRYAAGDFDALTSQQRRGLGLLRSAATRCIECHAAPTFMDDDYRIIGVPDNGSDDRGYGATIDGDAMDFAFKIPTLRNVVLSAPYMHNGAFETLDEVVDFYSNGGGPGAGFDIPNIDRAVAPGFDLTEQEQADLVAFLYALVDETIPERYWEGLNYIDDEGYVLIPDSVPSGLDDEIVPPVDNPAREVIAVNDMPPEERPGCERDADAQTVIVTSTIQAAVDCAESGDTILVPPGVYHERVIIDLSGITLRGMVEDSEPETCPLQTEGDSPVFPDDAVNWAILDGDVDGDGEKDLTDGVIASGNDFTMEFFVVRNYAGNGVLVEGVRGVTLRHLFTSDTGLYGVYPVRSDNVLVECNVTTLATDAGIYVGQSRDIVVRHNLAYDGVTGIEIENSVNADVYNNETWGNTGGILVFLLPNIHSRVSHHINVYDNYVHHNNRPKGDATPGSIVGQVPIGTGIFLMATDHAEIYHNVIEGNNSFGVAIVSLYQAYEPEEIGDVGPLSENNRIHDNTYIDNGNDPAQEVRDTGMPGADVLWDARGFGNYVNEADANVFPPIMPGENWLPFMRRAVFQILNFLGKNI